MPRVLRQFAAIILAAGASQRMGTPKALLPWGGSTLLDYALEQAQAAGAEQIVVVFGPATRNLRLRVPTVFNPQPETGRSTSIRLAAAAVQDDTQPILIQSVDQPVPARVLSQLVEALTRDALIDIVVPIYQGRRGHPVLLAGALLPELRAVTEEDQGLRAVVKRHAGRVAEVTVSDESVVWNLNDPAAYAAARARLKQ